MYNGLMLNIKIKLAEFQEYTVLTLEVRKTNNYSITLRDVARLAKVSVGTVSRYINKHPSVGGENAQKIQMAIDKLGYIPNQIAQSLAKGVSNNLLLYIIQEDPILSSTWLYELPIIQGVYDYLKSTDYSLQVAIDSIENSKRVNKLISECINNKRVDGMIILTSWEIDKSGLIRLADSKFPFVLIGNENLITPENEVLFDNYGAINQIIDYLYKLGHRRIGFISGTKEQQHAEQRIRAYFDSLQRLDLVTNEEWVKYGDYSIESGYIHMQELLHSNEQPTAIVCGNDYLAAGAIKAISEKGFNVPYDYSITGFDDSLVSKVVEPGLTTVNVPLQELAKIAIKKLINIINAPDKITPKRVLPCTMVIGASTSEPKYFQKES